MRKSALLLAVLLAASFTTTADAAKRKRPVVATPAPALSANQASVNLVTGFISNMVMPPAHTAAAAPAPAKKVRHARHKRSKARPA